MKMTTTRSPKFRRLMRLTGLNRAAAAGSLELLWLWTMEQAPAGNVGKWTDDDIEAELDWVGQPGELVASLISAGWLDPCETHRLVIHDWVDHLPEFIRKRVDRGTLTIAVSADNGSQRPPPADNGRNVPIREGKSREDKIREGKGGTTSGLTAPSSPISCCDQKKTKKVSCSKTAKPETFSEDQLERVRSWAVEKGYSNGTLDEAMELFRAWEPLKFPKRTPRAWISAYMKICRESVDEGKIGKSARVRSESDGPTPRQLRARERVAEAKLERAGGSDSQQIGDVIDLSLRAADGGAA